MHQPNQKIRPPHIRRLFVALDIPDTIKSDIASRVQSSFKEVRAVNPLNLHLTLHFLGDFDEGIIPTMDAALKTVKHAPFNLTLKGAGTFPYAVLWLGVEASESLRVLKNKVSAALVSAGLPKDQHDEFNPHVTVGRKRRIPDEASRAFLSEHKEYVSECFAVKEFILFEKILYSKEVEYPKQGIYPLL